MLGSHGEAKLSKTNQDSIERGGSGPYLYMHDFNPAGIIVAPLDSFQKGGWKFNFITKDYTEHLVLKTIA
jgi:hypothetical protein